MTVIDPPKILVVDDVELNCALISSMLEDAAVDVHSACSGRDALTCLKEFNYALVIMDVDMPEMNGFECVGHMRKDDELSETPVIFLTGLEASDELIEQGYELGAVDYLIKPVRANILAYKVKALVELFELRRKLDIEAKKANEARLNSELLLNHSADGILGVDRNATITFANVAASTLLTRSKKSLIGMNIKEIVDPQLTDEEWKESDFYRIYADGQCNQEYDGKFWRDEQTSFPVQYTQATVFDGHELVGGVLSFQDISERKLVEEKIVALAKYDQLTGLANRTTYWEHINQAISQAKRRVRRVMVLFIDLDHFKEANDRFGHDCGDYLLREAARRIKSCIRESDLACRMGGDEFAVVIPDPKDIDEGLIVGKKIVASLKQPNIINSQEVFVGASIGVACFPDNGYDSVGVTRAADVAMYSAKRSGRNCVRLFDEKLHNKITERMEIADALKYAIANDELEFYYQPKVDLETYEVNGMEALLRWQHPKKGFINPELIIEIAESSGLIEKLGDWTFRQGMKQVKEWHDASLLSKGWSLSINASAKQLKKRGFAERFINLMKGNTLPEGIIEIELTETAIMKNPHVAITELNRIREVGINVSIDDFGTGYSSLSYLQRLPLDILKIDKSFVADIGSDENEEAIIKAVIQLAHSLDLKVVAEGIETEEQLNFLKRFNCDIGQGYFFGRPVNAEAAKTFLIEGVPGRKPK